MNNKLLVAVTVAALSAGTYVGSALALGTGYTFGAGVVGSPHNMNDKLTTKDSAQRVCAFCHTPHHALQDSELSEYNPLWSHQVSQATFTGYASSTLDAVYGNGDPLMGPSRLCMSCHDGVVAVANHYNEFTNENPDTIGDDFGQISIGDANGTSLTNDHPIGFDFDAVANKEANGQASSTSVMIQGIKPATTTFQVTVGGTNYTRSIQQLLYKATSGTLNGKYVMTCASCHDVHNKENPEGWLLINKQLDSAICTTCHNK
jgi:Zn-finger protein